ncbi:MAG: penicillin-binding transpeptidase domain-containing protein, partial [Anaerolineales bacterium]|nr:penicillin-binding transpeptidase domain-containing protein [Anaerolineales bacterium]
TALGPVAGYTDPIYGQAGMEASLDETLRGIQGNPLPLIWWNLLVYGQPPPGIDVRTSLDLNLQTSADQLLQGNKGALVLLNASSGEILAMASHPTFNANRIQELGESLLQNPDSPLLNRATQGIYPVGPALGPLLLAEEIQPAAINPDQWVALLEKYGMYTSPLLSLPVASSAAPSGQAASTAISDLQASPLQIALAAASLSNNGVRPAPGLVTAIKEPERGWVLQPTLASSQRLFGEAQVKAAVRQLAVPGQLYWQTLAVASLGDEVVTWWLGGTLPEWNGAPLALVVLLEENNPALAEEIGQKTLQNGMGK